MGASPASWKSKCTIRSVDELGRFTALEPRDSEHLVTQTLRMNPVPPPLPYPPPVKTPSIAPLAYDLFPVAPWDDLEDRLEPARNSDVLGVRTTQAVSTGYGSSFWAGVVSGSTALLVCAGIAFASLTADGDAAPRDRSTAAHRTSTLEVIGPDDADRLAPRGKQPRGAAVVLLPGDIITPDMLPDAR